MTNETPVPRRVRSITHAEARLLLDAALAAAENAGVRASVAVVDATRELVAFGRQDGAPVLTVEIATAKAFTAASLRQSTAALAGPADAGGVFAGLAHGSTRPLVTFAGGLPLFDGDDLAGAVGASGGSLEEDEAIAQAALAVFEGWAR